MTHIDNSQEMSPEKVKEVLTNLISKTAEKTTAEGNYDRTILAKIQYCSDATIGQYKIQYQNGYYTAYALDKTKRYSNGAHVYVTVPGNNLNNRLFIQDLATNDNSQRTYLTNLEGDQQFAKYGQNLIKPYTTEFGLSSHWDMPKGREVFYYAQTDANVNNSLALIPNGDVLTNIRGGDGYIRIGASFRTNLPDSRKLKGNYGLRVVLTFKREDPNNPGSIEYYNQTYQLDTFSMDGSPFEFTDYSERCNYFEIDKENFVGIASISGFVEGFPESSVRPEPIDIYIKDINIYSAIRLYDVVNDYTYKVNIWAPEGVSFNLPADGEEEITSLRLEAQFSYNGIPVDLNNQDVEVYWAKKNLNIGTDDRTKYMPYFGQHWQCLNKFQKTDSESTDPEYLKNPANYVVSTDAQITEYPGVVKWVSADAIDLRKDQCPGRETIIKCCVRYENNTYESRELIIYNTSGYYLLLDSSEGTTFYNGNGSTTVTAGVFRTRTTHNSYEATPSPNPFEPVNNIVYKWEILNNGVSKELPYKSSGGDNLVNEPDWENDRTGLDYSDKPTETDEHVEEYLTQLATATGIDKTLLKYCYQRWQYYTRYYQNLINEGSQDDPTYTVAKARADAIESGWQDQLDKYYVESFQNPLGFYILGPSNVYPKWTVTAEELQKLYENREDPHQYAAIDHIVHTYNAGSSTYSDYQRNTLYNLQAAEIRGQMKISVTASLVEQVDNETVYTPLETQELYLNNTEGSGLEYDLQITNGTQTFVYNAGGKKPNISIKPLSFQLFQRNDGTLIFDSAKENNPEFIELLDPQWKFYTGNTLLLNKYEGTNYCEPDPNTLNRYILNREPIFTYDIAEDYNVNYKERSNIELSVTYNGARYTAETNFTFTKQGDLGTNGTNMFLSIEDNKYEQYRSDVLSMDMYSQFAQYNGENSDIVETYYPNERHLKETYLYATAVYDSEDAGANWTIQESFDDGDFCNLKIAQTGSESKTITNPTDPMHIVLNGTITANLYGYWVENGVKTAVAADSKWSTSNGNLQEVRDQTKLGRAKVYDRASFNLSPTTGDHTVVTLTPPANYSNDDVYFYKPMEVMYSKNGNEGDLYEWTAYNVVQCEASKEVQSQINPLTGDPIERTNFGYYQMPFFYYGYYRRRNGGAYENLTPKGLDPARHFVVYGGYDEVIYGADGVDPQYNKQTPFTFRLFDKDGKDITEEALSDPHTQIEWKNSYGLQSLPFVDSIPEYSSYPAGKSLLYKYCTYNNQTYYCIQNHTPDQKVEVKDSNGNVMKVYNANGTAPYDFVTPYWRKVSPNIAKNTRSFTPPPTYESCAVDTLFSSWVSVKIFYYKGEEKYEAAALLPINILQNVYGSDEINGWDGKKTVVDDGYIISNKIAAGYKDKTNAFIGVTLGTKMITNGIESTASSEEQIECGLFGYGKFTDSNLGVGRIGYGQTLFLDAKTGLAAFGPRGSTQIILNPRIPKEGTNEESWSRLAGWYFSNNYLYKPLFADDTYDGLSSYIDTNTGEVVAASTHKDYYNTSPPDADGAIIPGSVGLYVPGRNSGTLTPDTVFMWASAAGMASVDFNDDGSFDALADNVSAITRKCNSSNFPPYYDGFVTIAVDIEPQISHTFLIDNIGELADTYSDDSALLTLIGNYNTAFGIFERAIGDNYDELPPAINQVRLDIQSLINTSPFPVVVRDGAPVKPDLSTPLTIVNVDDLKKWYLESNEPGVTLQNASLASLNDGLNEYERLRNELANNPQSVEDVDFAIQGLKDAVSLIKQHFTNNYPVKRTKNKTDWNTSLAVLPVVDDDRVTITNIEALQTDYARSAYLASDAGKAALNDLNTMITSYLDLHAQYETWKDNWQTNLGKPIGYKSSNADKKQANFSLTYGGALHCVRADIEGKITAKTGKIGEGNEAIEIGVNNFDSRTGRNNYYLLWNKAFKVSYNDAAQPGEPSSSVFVDGDIIARSGQIGNTDNVKGNDNHTVFMEYEWYARKLPDDNLKWGDNPSSEDYRKPIWDENQRTKYIFWHPYFSIIDDPKGSKNYHPNGDLDFSYKAGDACFLGRIYATGGRLGDWICDTKYDLFRDPYDTIKLKPALRKDHPEDGWINCSTLTLYGDGSIYGGCSVPAGQDPRRYEFDVLPKSTATWWITADGEAHFTNLDSEYTGKSFKTSSSGGTSVTSSGVTTSGTVSVGDTTISSSGSTATFSGGASFSGDISTSGALTATSFTAGSTILSNGSLDLGSCQLRSASAQLPATTFTGALSLGANGITSTGTSSLSVLNVDTLYIGNQTIEQYIKSVVKSYIQGSMEVIVGGSTKAGTGTGSDHTHPLGYPSTIATISFSS